MLSRIKNIIAKRREKRQHKEQERQQSERDWKVTIYNATYYGEHERQYHVYLPEWLARKKIVPVSVIFGDNDFTIWAKMQARIFSRIQQHWPESHTYIRLYTYYIPDYLITKLKKGQFEKSDTKEKHTHLFLIPDCQDPSVWEAFFEIGTNDDGGRTIFSLDYRPRNWREIIARLFEIFVKLYKTPGGRFPGFERALSRCHLWCFSVDADLVIGKVDLPESTVLSILESVASEESLKLVIDRKSRNLFGQSTSG
jgi:hypothetical protein